MSKITTLSAGLIAVTLSVAPTFAQTPQPSDFTNLSEALLAHAPTQDIAQVGKAIDRDSNLRLTFDQTKAIEAFKRTPDERLLMTIRVQARIQHKDGQPQPIPVDNFSRVSQSKAGDKADKVAYSISYNDEIVSLRKSSDGSVTVTSWLPSSFINLNEQGIQAGDKIFITVTDIETQSDINYAVDIADYGWNRHIVDSMLLMRRLGVSDDDIKQGTSRVLFRPSPGVMSSGVYTSRKNPFLRAISPGVGAVFTFTNWNDGVVFDPSSGQFAKDTDANQIEFAFGFVGTLFDNTFQVSYGWNLNVEKDPRYFAIGFSFFNLTDKLASLIKK